MVDAAGAIDRVPGRDQRIKLDEEISREGWPADRCPVCETDRFERHPLGKSLLPKLARGAELLRRFGIDRLPWDFGHATAISGALSRVLRVALGDRLRHVRQPCQWC